MKALNVILIASGKTSEATSHIWVVSVSGQPSSRVYCKGPYKAMRYAFLLKKRTGLNISDNCLCRLSHEIARTKAAAATQPIELQPTEPLTSATAKKSTKKAAPKKRTARAKAKATA